MSAAIYWQRYSSDKRRRIGRQKGDSFSNLLWAGMPAEGVGDLALLQELLQKKIKTTKTVCDYKAKKKSCYVALTRPKFKNWVGRSGFFFFFFFTYRERVEFSNIFFQVSKWGKLGRNAVKTHIQVMQVLF